MRKLVVLTFISLDGVMQAPGGKEEDSSDGFDLGGWTVPYFDEVIANEMGIQMNEPFDLLVGRKTFDLFSSYWLDHSDEDPFKNAKRYIVTHRPVISEWGECISITSDVINEIKHLKQQDGPMLQVHGSGVLIQSLLENNLVDEFWLKIFPITLGKGKRLFSDGTLPTAYKLTELKSSASGVIIAYYKNDGKVKLGSL